MTPKELSFFSFCGNLPSDNQDTVKRITAIEPYINGIETVKANIHNAIT